MGPNGVWLADALSIVTQTGDGGVVCIGILEEKEGLKKKRDEETLPFSTQMIITDVPASNLA